MTGFATNDEFYAFVDALSERLQHGELAVYGQRLHFLLHKVAWTTTSELFAELGGVLEAADRKVGADASPDLRSDIQRCIATLRAAWPGIRFTMETWKSPPNQRL